MCIAACNGQSGVSASGSRGVYTPGHKPPGHTLPLGKHSLDRHPPPTVEMTTEAGGTHPTRMHSYYYLNLHNNVFNWILFPNYFHQKLYENANIVSVVFFVHYGKTRITANNKHDEIASQMNSALNCFRTENALLKISRIFNENAHLEHTFISLTPKGKIFRTIFH